MGVSPQTPLPPAFTFLISAASAPLSLRYFAATSLYDGPITFLSMPWQVVQPLACASFSLPYAAGATHSAAITAHAADVGDNADTVEAAIEGSPTSIAFNARYLIDVLSALGADEAALELSGPLAPGVIRGIGKDDYVHVIMPVRTAS